jgi:hypothetical protein
VLSVAIREQSISQICAVRVHNFLCRLFCLSMRMPTRTRSGRPTHASACSRPFARSAADHGLEHADRPEIDHDTRGEPGMVNIAASILSKIALAAFFVADLTPVALRPLAQRIHGCRLRKVLRIFQLTLSQSLQLSTSSTHRTTIVAYLLHRRSTPTMCS